MIITQDIINLVTFISVMLLISILVFNNIRLALSNKKLISNLVQSTIDKMSLEDGLYKLSQEYDLVTGSGSDGFIKFLSDSREWAFNYIEEVQASIKSLAEAMATGDETAIAKAYAEVIKHLPKEEEK